MEKALASASADRGERTDRGRANGQLFLGRDASREEAPRFTGRFSGETVLIVDDDVRNVFALTSVLEQRGLSVRYAENGREGVDVLERADHIDVVLMDIMMPEMDGYATMAAIRRMDRFADLPIIALTAKAMHGDREKALDAGASEYVTKPVDIDQLLGLIRSWLDAGGDDRPVR
jgi:CheY-like chemotaxis protein